MEGGECDPELEEKMRRNPELFSTSPVPKRLFCYDWANGFLSPFVASAESTVKRILKTVREPSVDLVNLKADDIVYDLGCGDGRFLIAAAQGYNCRGIGIDLDEGIIQRKVDTCTTVMAYPRTCMSSFRCVSVGVSRSNRVFTFVIDISQDTAGCNKRLTGLVSQARALAKEAGVSEQTEFKCMDLREMQLEGADVIVIFLLPVAISGIKERLVKYLRDNPEAAVVSVLWELPGCADLEMAHCQGAQDQWFRVYSANRRLANVY
eukprot:9504185-Pyramimonas_sp.AAC.2